MTYRPLLFLVALLLFFLCAHGSPVPDRTIDSQTFPTPEERIVGGAETKQHAWPWMVQLAYRGAFTCGGSLIAPAFVVTAAHCVDGLRTIRPERFTVFTGGHTSLSGQQHKVLNISMHPLYNPARLFFDIAILKISPEATLSERVQPISLPLLPPLDHQTCTVTGWGRTETRGPPSAVLLELRVPIVPFYVCNDFSHYWGSIFYPSMICAGFEKGGSDACFGDSGGPLMCQRGDKWELQGVVSWGRGGCAAAGYPTVYTRVWSSLPFLRTSMFLLR